MKHSLACVGVLAILLSASFSNAKPPARAAPLSASTFTVNSVSDVVASPPPARLRRR